MIRVYIQGFEVCYTIYHIPLEVGNLALVKYYGGCDSLSCNSSLPHPFVSNFSNKFLYLFDKYR